MTEWDLTGKVEKDQPVRVFDVNGRRMGQPEDGWEGVVTHVGRKLFKVRYGRVEHTFTLEYGRRNDRYGHRYVKTLTPADEDKRMDAAKMALRGAGLHIEKQTLTLTQYEAIASLIERF